MVEDMDKNDFDQWYAAFLAQPLSSDERIFLKRFNQNSQEGKLYVKTQKEHLRQAWEASQALAQKTKAQTEQEIFEEYNWITVDESGGNPEKTLDFRKAIHEAHEAGFAQGIIITDKTQQKTINKIKEHQIQALLQDLKTLKLWPSDRKLAEEIQEEIMHISKETHNFPHYTTCATCEEGWNMILDFVIRNLEMKNPALKDGVSKQAQTSR